MSPHVSSASSLATVDVPVVALTVDVDARTDIDGLQYTMIAVKDVPMGVQTVVGQPGLSIDLAPGSTVKAKLSGPGLAAPVTLAAVPNAALEFPRLAVAGLYYLTHIRLEDPTGVVLLERDPTLDTVVIDVVDELLVTEVTSRPLTEEEIQEAGIVIDEDSYTAVNFTVGLTIGSEEVKIELPVLIPENSSTVTEPATVPGVGLGGSTSSGIETIDIPNMSISGFSMDMPPEVEIPGVDVPPINGVIIIPGTIAFLHQFFSVIVVATNVTPDGSGLIVQNALASIALPDGDDGISGTGDDPLDMAVVAGGGNEPVQLLLDESGSDSIVPQQSNQAEYLVEGLREGAHRVTFDITGDLFLPSLGSTVPISGLAAGIVQVRNPTFNVVLAHPQTVREGEEYSLFATVTNTSISPANQFQLNLSERSLSGALLAPGETGLRTLETLAAGQAETFEYRLVARTTGEVTGTVALADPSINGSFVLTTGVGDTGIPLSPDSIILPQTVEYLPDDPDVVLAAIRLIGQAYSVATAPSGALPPDVARVSKDFVFDRAVKLAQVGLHTRFGQSDASGALDLVMDLAGADAARLGELYGIDPATATGADAETLSRALRDLEAFDALRRTTNAGLAVSDALAGVIGDALATESLADLQLACAERFASRPAHLSLAASSSGGPVYLRIRDAGGRAAGQPAGGRARDLPFAAYLPLAPDAAMAIVAAPESALFDLELYVPAATDVELSAIVPLAGGMAQITFPATPLPAGALGRVVWEDGVNGPFDLEIDTDADGLLDFVVPPAAVTPIVDPPPAILGVHLWGKGSSAITPLTFDHGDPLGRLVGVLFSEEVDRASASPAPAYSAEANRTHAVQVQPDDRVVFVNLELPAGPFVPRTLAATGVLDRRGNAVAETPATIQSDPERGDGGVVSGVVRGPDGTPIPFATIAYIQPVYCAVCDFGAGRAEDRIVSRLTTDALGRFQLDFVLQNDVVSQDPDRWLNAQTAGGTHHFKLEATDPLTGNIGKASTRVLYDGQRMSLDVIIRGYGTIVGTVREESGAPVAGHGPASAEPLLVLAENISTGERVLGWVDDTGSYGFPSSGAGGQVPMMPVGNVVLRTVRASDASTAVATTNIPYAGATVEQDLFLLPANRFGTVTGRVVEADGQTGAANVLVQISARGVGVGPIEAQTTDAAGGFSFSDVPAGDIRLLAYRAETFEQARAASYLPPDGAQDVTLVLPGTGGTARGFVVDGLGSLVEGATVASGPSLTTTDENGFFELPSMPLGTSTVFAQGPNTPGIGQQQVTIQSSGEVVDIVIELEPVGSIIGTVYEADGITPVSGQQVQLWVAPGDGVLGRTLTNENGQYELLGYPIGDYSVRAVRADFGDGGMASTSIRFAGDAQNADIRLRGLGSVSGRVIQTDATPVIADLILTRNVWRIFTSATQEDVATVEAVEALAGTDPLMDQAVGAFLSEFTVPAGDFFMLRAEPVLVRSDILGPGGEVTGEFLFDGPITGGPFTIEAFGPFLSPAVATGEIPNTTVASERDVDVGDIVLEASTGQISGTVFLPDGLTPVGAGVRVVARSLDSYGSAYAPGVLPEIEALTDELGAFHFPLVLTGSVILEADTGAPASPAASAAEMQTELFELLNVRLYGRASGAVPPDPGVLSVSLRLHDVAGVDVTVVEADGTTPVPFAEVTLRTSSTLDAAEEPSFFRQTAGAGGAIDFFPVIEGNASIVALDLTTGASGQAAAVVPRDPQNGHVVPVLVTLGAVTSQDGDVVVSTGFGTVEGTVLRADGTLLDNPSEVTIRASGTHILTTSNASGFFSADAVPLGTFSVAVFEPFTARRGSASGYLASDGDTESVTITLVGLGTVTGTVWVHDGSSSISAAAVTLYPSGDFSAPLAGTTNTLGTYVLPGVAVGPYRVEADDPTSGLAGEAPGTMLADGDTNTTDVFIDPYGAITGTVFDATGAPAVVENVTVTIAGSGVVRVVQTDTSGTFESGPYLPAGGYTIIARPQGIADGARATTSIDYHGHVPDVALTLAGRGTIEGMVLDSAGTSPVAFAQVTLNSSSPYSPEPAVGITDGSGGFVFADVPVGRFSLSVVTTTQSPQLGASASGELAAHAQMIGYYDGDPDLEHDAIRLEDAGTIQGTVLLSDGSTPAERAIVEVQGGQVQLAQQTGPDGSFAFHGLPLAAYSVSIVEPVTNGVASRNATIPANEHVEDLGPIVLDSEAPVVVSTIPVPDAPDVAPASAISITFSEPIDPGTVAADTFIVQISGNAVAGSRSVIGDSATFTPSQPFADRSRVGVTLLADEKSFEGEVLSIGIRDLSGLSIPADRVFEFSTADATGPVLVSVSPPDGATEVPVDALVRVEFGEPLDPASVASFILQNAGGPVPASVDLILDNRVVLLTPAAPLATDASYTVTLTGPVTDLSGNPHAAAVISTTFATVDTQPPSVTSLTVPTSARLVHGATVRTTATVSDPADIAVVELYVAGALAGSDPSQPYELDVFFDPSLGATVELTAYAIDAAGNRSQPETLVLALADNQPPQATLIAPASMDVTLGATVFVVVEATDDVGIAQVSYAAGAGAFGAGTQSFAGLPSAQANFTFQVPGDVVVGTQIVVRGSTTDTLGLTSAAGAGNQAVLTVVDAVAPTVSIGSPAAGSLWAPGATLSVFVQASDPSGIEQIDLATSGALVSLQTEVISPPQTDATASFQVTIPVDAGAAESLFLTATATDTAGNPGTSQIVAGIADVSGPTIDLALAGGGTQVSPGSTVVVEATVTDEIGVSRVELVAGDFFSDVEILGAAPTSAVASFSLTIPTGIPLGDTFLVLGTARDTSGNETQAAPLVLTAADLSPPAVAIIEPLYGSLVDPGAGVTVRITATDDFSLGSFSFRATGAAAASDTQVVDLTGPDAVGAEATFSFQVPSDAASNAAIYVQGSATDQSGNSGSASQVTLYVRDLVPPALVSVSPPDGSTGVPASQSVIATFDEPLAPATVSPATAVVTGPSGQVSSTVELVNNGQSIRLTPLADLDFGATYTFTVSTAVTDVAGNALPAPVTSSFTVVQPDTTPPAVVSVVPVDGAVGVDPSTQITLTFSEPMATATLVAANIIIQDDTGVISGTFTPQAGDTEVAFTPDAPLAVATGHTIEVTTSVTDAAGNPLVEPFYAAFTTLVPDFDPPVVAWIDPADGATGVELFGPVEVAFSEAIDTGSITPSSFRVSSSSVEVAGSYQFLDAGARVRWAPTVALQSGTTYDVALSAGITDPAGNPLAPFASVFSTTSQPALDSDSDGVSDANELELGTDPYVADDFTSTHIVIDGRTATLDGTLTLASLTLQNGAVVTHPAATTTETFGLILSLETLTIDATSSIDTLGRGYLGGGKGDNTSFRGRTLGNQLGAGDYPPGSAGGSHGGYGGPREDGSGLTPTYGDFADPRELGSGGGAGPNLDRGGNGGGRVRIIASSVQLDGAIRCDGEDARANGSGGSGGSVSLRTGTLGGSGSISANGGESTLWDNPVYAPWWAGGGGGRVAVYFADKTSFAGTITAGGGFTRQPGGRHGGPGTVYLDDTTRAGYGTLIVDNLGLTAQTQPTPLDDIVTLDSLVVADTEVSLPAPFELVGGRLEAVRAGMVATSLTASGLAEIRIEAATVTIESFLADAIDTTSVDSGTLVIGGLLPSASVNLMNSSLLSHPAATTTQTFALEIAASSIQIDATSAIDVNDKGYLGGRQGDNTSTRGRTLGNQLGADRVRVYVGSSSDWYSFGGSHGGLGGPGFYNFQDNVSGPVYADLTDPQQLGSGGSATDVNTPGGSGGGLVRISTSTLHVDGAIRANGGIGYAGAGSGGGIRIDVTTLSGSGVIEANGSDAYLDAEGAGGGGRVAVYYGDLSAFAGTIQALGGQSGTELGGNLALTAGAGTVYLRDLALPAGDTVVDASGRRAGHNTTPLRAIGYGTVSALAANSMTDSNASYPLPDPATGALGLVGLELNPDITQTQTFTVVGNTATTLYTDPADGDMTTVADVGDAYVGIYTFNNLGVLGLASLETADNVQIVGDSLQAWSSYGWLQDVFAPDLQTLEVDGSTLSMGGIVFTVQASVTNGGVLTHPAATTTRTFSLELNVAGTLTIEAGSAIDASGKGYLGGNQYAGHQGRALGNLPGADSLGGDARSQAGGSYGGLGGPSYWDSSGTTVSPVYGDFANPTELGSGGAGLAGNSNYKGGSGGGLLHIVADSIQLDGALRANGASAYSSGGGSGGGIRIDVTTLQGTGSVEANGGIDLDGASAGGGGGRIAIYYDDASAFAGTVSAAGGLGPTSYSGDSMTGGAGTIYWQGPAQTYGELHMANNGNAARPGSTPLRAVGPGTSTDLAAYILTDSTASFPLPDPSTGALGLIGLELDPGGGGITFTVVDNTSTQIWVDPTGGNMTSYASPGDAYIGIYTLDGLQVTGGAQVTTADNVILLTPAVVDGTSTFTSNNLTLP